LSNPVPFGYPGTEALLAPSHCPVSDGCILGPEQHLEYRLTRPMSPCRPPSPA